jgi:probable F420-dependent oxidoreductase
MYQYPETTGSDTDLLDSGPVDDVARAVEESGWMGLAFTEHPIPGARWLENGGHQTLDPLVTLGFAAAVTSRIKLLTYLVVAPYRNPFLLAKAAATVDKLSGGRMVLGMGTGYAKTEFYALGVDMEERNALFDEALDVLPLHWSGESFSYKGIHFDARDVIARPRPVQHPIPIWIGGNAKVTRRRVGEKAQGWMPLVGGPTLNVTARTATVGDLTELSEMIAEIRDVARARNEPIDILYPYQDATIFDPKSDTSRHRDALAELEHAGVTWTMISGRPGDPAQILGFLRDFGDTYT